MLAPVPHGLSARKASPSAPQRDAPEASVSIQRCTRKRLQTDPSWPIDGEGLTPYGYHYRGRETGGQPSSPRLLGFAGRRAVVDLTWDRRQELRRRGLRDDALGRQTAPTRTREPERENPSRPTLRTTGLSSRFVWPSRSWRGRADVSRLPRPQGAEGHREGTASSTSVPPTQQGLNHRTVRTEGTSPLFERSPPDCACCVVLRGSARIHARAVCHVVFLRDGDDSVITSARLSEATAFVIDRLKDQATEETDP
jgi:hypothetical protein